MAAPVVTLKHHLQMGSFDANSVSFEIEALEDTELFARIEIPCGMPTASRTFLCRDAQLAPVEIEFDPVDASDGSLSRDGSLATGNNRLVWKSTGSFNLAANRKIAICITGINPPGSGNASLTLKLWSDHDEPAIYDQPVSVSSVTGPAIIDFNVSATSVLQGDKITITAYTSNAKDVILLGNDIPIKSSTKIEPSTPGESETKYVYSDVPQRNTHYRLEARRDHTSGSHGDVARRELSVEVDPRNHWYNCDLLVNSLRSIDNGHNFYPTLLLPAKDLSGQTPDERLYGIFVNKETKEASLWSSSSGLVGWRWEDDVPAAMSESSGVIHNQALWLIGGSSANPFGTPTNCVWWWYLDKDTNEMVWKKAESRALPERMCHTCASFNDRVWIFGGLDENNKELKDVWTCADDPRSGNLAANWTQSSNLPSGRCMSAAAVTPAGNGVRGIEDRSRLWLLGGATHPINLDKTFDELLWTEDGLHWNTLAWPAKSVKTPDGKTLTIPLGKPLGATLLYGTDRLLHLAGVFREPDFKEYDYRLLGVDLENPSWVEGSMTGFGWNYQTDLFLIRSVSFRERWIFWPVYQDWSEKTVDNPRIYNVVKQS